MVNIAAIEKSIMTADEKTLEQMAGNIAFEIYQQLSPEARSRLAHYAGGGFRPPLKEAPKVESRVIAPPRFSVREPIARGNKIFKYVLQAIDQQTVDIPLPAIVLSVAEQEGNIVLYALVDDSEGVSAESIDVRIVGTGHPVKEDIGLYAFIGTVKLYDGKLMFHVFYRRVS